MTLRPVLSILALAFSAGIVASGTAADWPIFHGPDGSNKSPDTGLLKKWPEAGPELIWQADGKRVSAEQVWENKKFDNHHGGVIFLDGYIYGTNARGQWMCLDWKTGKAQWAEKGIGKGSVTFADGLLYGFDESEKKRTVGLIKPSPDAYELISEFQLPEGGKGNSWAHPVVIGGRLYLRHGDLLYVYDVKAD